MLICKWKVRNTYKSPVIHPLVRFCQLGFATTGLIRGNCAFVSKERKYFLLWVHVITTALKYYNNLLYNITFYILRIIVERVAPISPRKYRHWLDATTTILS